MCVCITISQFKINMVVNLLKGQIERGDHETADQQLFSQNLLTPCPGSLRPCSPSPAVLAPDLSVQTNDICRFFSDATISLVTS